VPAIPHISQPPPKTPTSQQRLQALLWQGHRLRAAANRNIERVTALTATASGFVTAPSSRSILCAVFPPASCPGQAQPLRPLFSLQALCLRRYHYRLGTANQDGHRLSPGRDLNRGLDLARPLLRLSDMAARKIPKSVIRACIKRELHRTRSVSIVIDDVDSVRVDPNAAGSPTPPWRRRGDAGRMAS
jgi:hypothetical protein